MDESSHQLVILRCWWLNWELSAVTVEISLETWQNGLPRIVLQLALGRSKIPKSEMCCILNVLMFLPLLNLSADSQQRDDLIWVLLICPAKLIWTKPCQTKGNSKSAVLVVKTTETLLIPKAAAIVEWVIFHALAVETKVSGMDNSDAHARLDVAKGGRTGAPPFFTEELSNVLEVKLSNRFLELLVERGS